MRSAGGWPSLPHFARPRPALGATRPSISVEPRECPNSGTRLFNFFGIEFLLSTNFLATKSRLGPDGPIEKRTAKKAREMS